MKALQRTFACIFSAVICLTAGDPAIAADSANRTSVLEKREALEARFGVRIGRAGELVAEIDGARRSGKAFHEARDPEPQELAALEFALLRSHRARSLSVYFLKETCYGDRCATWTQDTSGKPMVIVEPGRTQLDDPLERVLLHELAHDAMFRMGLDPDHASNWKYAEALGWQRFSNPRTAERGWMIRSIEGGEIFYKLGKYSGDWIRCNVNGQPLTSDCSSAGKARPAFALGAAHVQSQAAVKPATDYFDTPFEVLAEGLMLYRAGAETRRRLAEVSPKLYEIVRQFDYSNLSETFGRGVMTREDDGTVRPHHVAVLTR